MKKIVMLTLLSLVCLQSSYAQNADQYLNACFGTDTKMCEGESKDFTKNITLAYKKDYQAQRNVAYCLFNGCSNAVIIKKTLSCAWRMVILSSGSPKIDNTDKSNFEVECSRIDIFDRETARMQADELSKKIYKRDIAAGIMLSMLALPNKSK